MDKTLTDEDLEDGMKAPLVKKLPIYTNGEEFGKIDNKTKETKLLSQIDKNLNEMTVNNTRIKSDIGKFLIELGDFEDKINDMKRRQGSNATLEYLRLKFNQALGRLQNAQSMAEGNIDIIQITNSLAETLKEMLKE